MRYFLDVEFNGFCGELISIALVPELDGAAPFYEALDCAKPTPWVAEHVLPVLRTARGRVDSDAALILSLVVGGRPSGCDSGS